MKELNAVNEAVNKMNKTSRRIEECLGGDSQSHIPSTHIDSSANSSGTTEITEQFNNLNVNKTIALIIIPNIQNNFPKFPFSRKLQNFPNFKNVS